MGWVDGADVRRLEIFKQRDKILRERLKQLQDVIRLNRRAMEYRDQLADEGESHSGIETSLNTTSYMTAASTMITDITNALDNISWTHVEPVYPGGATDYDSADIDVDPGSITAQSDSTPFSSFAVNDIVKVYNCEDSENDGQVTIATMPNDYTLTFTTTLPPEGGGTDNIDGDDDADGDTDVIIELVQRGAIT